LPFELGVNHWPADIDNSKGTACKPGPNSAHAGDDGFPHQAV